MILSASLLFPSFHPLPVSSHSSPYLHVSLFPSSTSSTSASFPHRPLSLLPVVYHLPVISSFLFLHSSCLSLNHPSSSLLLLLHQFMMSTVVVAWAAHPQSIHGRLQISQSLRVCGGLNLIAHTACPHLSLQFISVHVNSAEMQLCTSVDLISI